MKNQNIHDVNDAFLVQRYGGGIKLIKPEDVARFSSAAKYSLMPQLSVANLLKMPFNVYFVDTNSVIQKTNELTIEICGFDSIKDAIGNTVAAAAKAESVLFEMEHEKRVIETNNIVIMEETYFRQDDANFSAIAIKFPWYNADNNIIGVFGCSCIIGQSKYASLSESLSLIQQTGLLSQSNTISNYPVNFDATFDINHLTPRETECLKLLVRGKTAKEIAKILVLSTRTVENYLATIKSKAVVSTKSELIEKAINHGFL